MAVSVAVDGFAVPRRAAGSGSVYRRSSDGLWAAELRTGRYRHYMYGATRKIVEAKLARLKARYNTRATEGQRGIRNEVRAANVRKIIESGIARGLNRGWSHEHMAEVIAAWLSPRRVNDGVWGPCVYCGEETASTVDHAISRVRGGTDEADNLVSACTRCNNRKGDLTADEFRQRGAW